MLKKTLAIIITTSAILALSACGLFSPVETEEVVTFDVSAFTKVESEEDTTVDTTEPEFEYTFSAEDYEYKEEDVPVPITVNWDRKTVTLEYDIVTDIRWSDDAPIYYVNGYAAFSDYGNCDDELPKGSNIKYNVINRIGNRVLKESYPEVAINHDRTIVAKTNEGTYMTIYTTGYTIETEEKDYLNAKKSLKLIKYVAGYKKYKGEEKLLSVGNEYKGLVPFIVENTGDPEYSGRLGLMDTDGNVVIEPIYKTNIPEYSFAFCNDDRIIIDFNGRIAILLLTVREIPESTPTPETPVNIPDPVVAQWGNKTVTLECDIVTDIRWPSSMGLIYFINDYAVFWNDGKYTEPLDYKTSGFNVLDKSGNIVLAENLQNLSDFDSNGIAKVHYENKLDKFYYINLKGERIDKEAYDGYNVTRPEQADCEALGIRHEGVGRYYIGETEVNHIGNNYNGLIPFLVGLPDSGNSLLGLMDTDLNIVIPATMEVYLPYNLDFYISEDRLVVNLDGRIAILKLTVEETPEAESTPEVTLEDQAVSLTKHLVRIAMISDWLEGKLEFTDERMTQFVYTLATLDEDDASHPYSDLSEILVENHQSYGLLEKEKAERALFEVFGKDIPFPLDNDNSMIVDGYIRVPREVGFLTTMYHPKDMTARIDDDMVRVTCSLEYEDRAAEKMLDIGDYEFTYKRLYDGEREYLRLDSIKRVNIPEKIELSGVYNGSEITMTLTLTEYNFPSCMFRPVGFENGYAYF